MTVSKSDVYQRRRGNIITAMVQCEGKLYGQGFESNPYNDIWWKRAVIELVDDVNLEVYGLEPSWERIEMDGTSTFHPPPSGVAALTAPAWKVL